MNICGPRPLNIEVSTVLPPEQLDQSKSQSAKSSQTISIMLPNLSMIVQNQTGLAFKGNNLFNQNKSQQNEIYEITSKNCNENIIKIRELVPNNIYPIYRVVQNDQEHQLKQNDIIKIGYFQLYVKSLHLGKAHSKPVILQSVRSPPLTPNSISQKQSNFQKNCRICLQNTSSKYDPLLCLCKCSGSVKYTHYQCLKIWYDKFLQKQQSDTCSYYHYGQGECQLCKQKLPLYFTVNNKKVSLASFQEDFQTPHIVFQLMNQTQESIQIIVLRLQDRPLVIGHSQQADLCFLDQSIDEKHCQIIFKNNKVYISDKRTLFGTFIKLRDYTKFSARNGIFLKIHNLQVKIQRKIDLFSWLCADQSYTILFDSAKNISSQQNHIFVE